MSAEPNRAAGRGRRVAIAVAAGAAWGWSHGITTHPLLAIAALVPLILLLEQPQPIVSGWIFGLVAWVTAIPWIVPTISTYGYIAGWLAALALVALCLVLGCYSALFGLLGARVLRLPTFFAVAGLAALWVALEVARGWLLTGFPWNLAAYAWTDLPGALPLASWIGAWGVSGLLVATSAGLARAWRSRRWETAAWALLVPAALLPIGARFARPAEAGGKTIAVSVLQPDIPDRPLFDAAANEQDYRRLLAMSAEACRPGALLIWPESASWPREWQDDPRLAADVRALNGRGCGVLLNSVYTAGGHDYNAALLVSPGAPEEPQMAAKRHLVPFGEYVPLRGVLPFAGKIARVVGDFTPAEKVHLLAWNGALLGAAICYEVVFPGETAELVRAGASLLVSVTNDGWYGDTAAPRQHLRAARFRAAENRRWLLRAAVTGISAAVRPDGSLAGTIGVAQRGVLALDVETRTGLSPFARAPWLVPLLCSLGAAAAIVRGRRGRGAP